MATSFCNLGFNVDIPLATNVVVLLVDADVLWEAMGAATCLSCSSGLEHDVPFVFGNGAAGGANGLASSRTVSLRLV